MIRIRNQIKKWIQKLIIIKNSFNNLSSFPRINRNPLNNNLRCSNNNLNNNNKNNNCNNKIKHLKEIKNSVFNNKKKFMQILKI